MHPHTHVYARTYISTRTPGGTDRYWNIYTHIHITRKPCTQTHAHTGSETDQRKKASYTSTYRVVILTKFLHDRNSMNGGIELSIIKVE